MAKVVYSPSFCDEIVKHFTVKELYKAEVAQEGYSPKTRAIVSKKFIMVATPPPHFSEFARKIGVEESVLYEWEAKRPDFKIAMQKARDMQQEKIINGGLCGHYESRFAQMVASNMFGWKSDGDTGKKPEVRNTVKEAWEEGEKKRKEQQGLNEKKPEKPKEPNIIKPG